MGYCTSIAYGEWRNTSFDGDGAGMSRAGTLRVVRLLLVGLTFYHAFAIPLRYIFAWLIPAKPMPLGLMPLARAPQATVYTVTIFSCILVILFACAFWHIWVVLRRWEKGIFFSHEIVRRIRHAGWFLIVIAPVQITAMLVGIATFGLAGRRIDWSGIASYVLANMPTGLLICGLLALLVSSAFGQALQMQHEARFTV